MALNIVYICVTVFVHLHVTVYVHVYFHIEVYVYVYVEVYVRVHVNVKFVGRLTKTDQPTEYGVLQPGSGYICS